MMANESLGQTRLQNLAFRSHALGAHHARAHNSQAAVPPRPSPRPLTHVTRSAAHARLLARVRRAGRPRGCNVGRLVSRVEVVAARGHSSYQFAPANAARPHIDTLSSTVARPSTLVPQGSCAGLGQRCACPHPHLHPSRTCAYLPPPISNKHKLGKHSGPAPRLYCSRRLRAQSQGVPLPPARQPAHPSCRRWLSAVLSSTGPSLPLAGDERAALALDVTTRQPLRHCSYLESRGRPSIPAPSLPSR
ncbi:hypothetical protein OH77DRAFT_605590 [Trametes cingulata]|nr:hypothetical protein OH77DRAFT_605590 [Trametes cingulata]